MGSESEENLDKCFEVVSAVVQKAGDVNCNLLSFNRINDWKIKFISHILVDSKPILEEQRCETKAKRHWPCHWNRSGSGKIAYQYLDRWISTPSVRMQLNNNNIYVATFLTQIVGFCCYDYSFIGEEATSEGAKCELTDAPTWIIDPVNIWFFNLFNSCGVLFSYNKISFSWLFRLMEH